MITKIRMVPLDKVLDSPFRNKKRNPIDPNKVEHIAESSTTTGFWKGIQGREVKDGFVQIAFGHHRVDAARKLGLKEIPIEVLELSDSDMLKLMSRENLRGDLPAAIEIVEATVKALGVGTVQVEEVDPKTRKDVLRYAPSFIPGKGCGEPGLPHAYFADSLASFLGGVYMLPNKKAQPTVRAALGILELEEMGVAEDIEKTLRVDDVDPSGRYKSAKNVMIAVNAVKERFVKVKERATRSAEEIREAHAKLEATQAALKESEAKAKKARDKELSERVAAVAESNAKEVRRIQKQLKEKAEAAEAKAQADAAKVKELETNIEAKKKAAEEQRQVDAYAPLRQEADRIVHILARRDMAEQFKALARKALSPNDRERVRQAALTLGEWYSCNVAELFLPPKKEKR
jgi:flagellar biosynthesis GTPase FlhF